MHEDPLIPTRHDHGHLGGVSLETITAARYPGQAAVKKGPSSIESRDTAPASRSSSQDTEENEHNAWHQHQQPRGIGALVMASNPDPFYSSNRISLKEAQDWDFSKKIEDLAAMESRTRERSFSEPQLSTMRPGATHEKHQMQRLDWQRLHHQQQEQLNMATVNEACPSAAWKMPTSMPSPPQGRQQQQQQGQRASRLRRQSDPCADACAGVTEALQRVWSGVGGLFGQGEEDQNHGVGTLRSKNNYTNARVSSACRHFASCTSTKTFEVSPSESDREALARLGVVPETGYRGIGAPASMTFTTHIAGYR